MAEKIWFAAAALIPPAAAALLYFVAVVPLHGAKVSGVNGPFFVMALALAFTLGREGGRRFCGRERRLAGALTGLIGAAGFAVFPAISTRVNSPASVFFNYVLLYGAAYAIPFFHSLGKRTAVSGIRAPVSRPWILPWRTLSILLWVAALELPAYVSLDPKWPGHTVYGWTCFLFGAFSILGNSSHIGILAWAANFPLFGFLILGGRKGERRGWRVLLVAGILLATTSFFVRSIMINEGGVGPEAWKREIGLYVWLASFAVALVGEIFASEVQGATAAEQQASEAGLQPVAALLIGIYLAGMQAGTLRKERALYFVVPSPNVYACSELEGLSVRGQGGEFLYVDLVEGTQGGISFRTVGAVVGREIRADSSARADSAFFARFEKLYFTCRNQAGELLSSRFRIGAAPGTEPFSAQPSAGSAAEADAAGGTVNARPGFIKEDLLRGLLVPGPNALPPDFHVVGHETLFQESGYVMQFEKAGNPPARLSFAVQREGRKSGCQYFIGHPERTPGLETFQIAGVRAVNRPHSFRAGAEKLDLLQFDGEHCLVISAEAPAGEFSAEGLIHLQQEMVRAP